jgi:hypothetical protein
MMNPVRSQTRNEAGDLLFKCQHCASPLVVNAAAAGMTLNCQRCGKPTLVPMVSASAASAPQELTDLQRKLKENESQRTEITGYINQLSIQLHRWKLRLQTLNERKTELEEELRKTT